MSGLRARHIRVALCTVFFHITFDFKNITIHVVWVLSWKYWGHHSIAHPLHMWQACFLCRDSAYYRNSVDWLFVDPLHMWQAWFLCKDSAYYRDSVDWLIVDPLHMWQACFLCRDSAYYRDRVDWLIVDPLHMWQAWLLCRDSAYYQDSVDRIKFCIGTMLKTSRVHPWHVRGESFELFMRPKSQVELTPPWPGQLGR